MNKNIHSGEYDALIKKIKRRRNIVVVLTIVLVMITITVCSPMEIVVLDETIVSHKGINPIFTLLFVLGILVFECIAYAVVSMPLDASLNVECNPQKYLILNQAFDKQNNKDHIYSVGYIYIGDFEAALQAANRMIGSNKFSIKMAGLYNKARCEYFLGDYDSLKVTVKQYENVLRSNQKLNQKTKDFHEKIQKTMNLLIALADEDKEKIAALCDIEAWGGSKATGGFINYLKGIAAYNLNDKAEAIYRFMLVKETCEKTVFAQLADKYLLNLNNEN